MKNLSYLIEGELEKAEVVLAAKSITDAIQKMAETVAKMEAEDVMPLNDPIREHFGPEAADKFAEAVGNALRQLTQNLSDTKNTISNEIARVQGELTDEPSSDLDSMGDEMEMPSEEDNTDLGGEITLPDDGEDEASAPEIAPEPRFGDEDMKAAGRARKESAAPKGKMLESINPDKIIAREYLGLLREGKTAKEAASVIVETYGLDLDGLIAIMESEKK